MTMMKNPIVDQGQILRVNPIMNDRADDLMGHEITAMSKFANDNKRGNITGDPWALLTEIQEDLRRLNVYYADTLLKDAYYELRNNNTFVIYPADMSLAAQIKDILEAPLSLIVKKKYNKSVEIVMRERTL